MAVSAHQRKAGRAFKAARSTCIRSESTVGGFDRCMSRSMKAALSGRKKRKTKTKRKRKR